MSVLVAYATRHGATAGIAERIATRLRLDGLPADAVPARDVKSPEAYDAFVVGSASYMFRWLGDANRFVDRHRRLLATRPLWLFSSGPLGTETVDKDGNDVLATAVPRLMPRLMADLHARDHRVFFGAWDPHTRPSGFVERLTLSLPAARAAFPSGDFRDWAAIETWADGIAAALGHGGDTRTAEGTATLGNA